MKLLPKELKEKETYFQNSLTPTQNLMRKLALILAFVSVFYFFVKLLFL